MTGHIRAGGTGQRPRDLLRLIVLAAMFATAPDPLGVTGGVHQANATDLRTAVPRQMRVTLPEIIGPGDVVLYRRIMAAENGGDWGLSDRLITALRDRRLVGTVLARRYLDKRHKASYGELADWLGHYRDHPDSDRLFALALKRKPGNAPRPKRPLIDEVLTGSGDDAPTWRDQVYRPKVAIDTLAAPVREAIKRGEAGLAAERFERARAAITDQIAQDALAGDVAAALFASGNDRDALSVAQRAARSAQHVPEAAWIAGLANWRMGRRDQALPFFEAVARSPAASDWTASAGAFWAARVHLTARRAKEAEAWLAFAADRPVGFYGQLAAHRLGRPNGYDWTLPVVHARQIAKLQPYPGVLRALALLQFGLLDQADAELRAAFHSLPIELQPVALTIAERGGLPNLAMRIATQIEQTGGPRFDAAFYPQPLWVPHQGFQVNRALLYALARHESRFNANAVSPRGASGLMQIMPETARGIAAEDGGANHVAKLTDPVASLDVAQRLIVHLMDEDRVRTNLVHLSIAYNGGPAMASRYQERLNHQDDPLLFLETLPSTEQRLYIKRVLTSFWAYQARLGQKPDSLDSLAELRWPLYVPSMRQTEVAESADARN